MRRGLTDRLTGVSLAALIATALMCVASVSVASAQSAEGPPLPELPFIPADEDAPVPPEDVAPPTSEPPATSSPPAHSEPLSPPPATAAAPKLMGSKIRWLRRTLSVAVSCGASGKVTVLRNGRRIGRSDFECPASGVVRVRVRISDAAARRLRAGMSVRVKVRTGADRDSKRMRVARAEGRQGARASSNHCTPWYVASAVALQWQTSTSWWEFFCYGQGFNPSGHLSEWWDFYFWNGNNQEYYGTWTHFFGDGCWYYWDYTSYRQYGPYGQFCP